MRILAIPVAFYAKFATFSDFKNFIFFSKNPLLKKNPNFERFENFHYFNRILQQLCYNLMKNIDIQTREEAMLARLRELNWQASCKKNAPI